MSKISMEVIENMMLLLLVYVDILGVYAVIESVYEIGVVFASKRAGREIAQDESSYEYIGADDVRMLLRARNAINHNSYNPVQVYKALADSLKYRVVEHLYIGIYGSCPGYDLFEKRVWEYLETMKDLWLFRSLEEVRELAEGKR